VSPLPADGGSGGSGGVDESGGGGGGGGGGDAPKYFTPTMAPSGGAPEQPAEQ